MGIGETLRRALVILIMGAAGYQAKIACGNLQLCAGIEAGIEGDTHDVGQRRLERLKGVVVASLADWMANSSPPPGLPIAHKCNVA